MNVFWYIKVYIIWRLIQYFKQMKCKSYTNILRTKQALEKCTFFFRHLQYITVLFLIRDSHTKHKVLLYKSVFGIFRFAIPFQFY